MNRRSFLTILSSGVVGLSLVDVEWIPTAIQSTTPLPSGLLTGLNQITAAVAREVGHILDLRGRFVPGDYSFGMASMTDQCSVDIGLDEYAWASGVRHDATIVPAAHVLAKRVRDGGLCRFGALPIPVAIEDGVVATDELSGVTVRGLRAFTLGSTCSPPHWVTRFDIIGGRAA